MTAASVQGGHRDSTLRSFLIFALVIFIAVIPKSRIDIGAPFYFVDGLLLILLIIFPGQSAYKTAWQKSVTGLAFFYWIFICLSEARGMQTNGTYMESIYMIFRFTLAISVISIVPRIIKSQIHVVALLKAIIVSILLTSSLAILSSLPPTRGLIEGLVFSVDLINPSVGAESLSAYLEAISQAGRGKSLVGVSVVTAGFLGALWPFAILASSSRLKAFNPIWLRLAKVASVLAPLGILATYGRTAWVIVITLGFMLFFFNYAKGRRTVVLTLISIAWVISVYGIYSKYFYVKRIVQKTTITLSAPLEHESERERFLSWVAPWNHLSENPVWLIFGEGTAIEYAGRRRLVVSSILDRSDLPSHSFFAASYYNFGMISAVIQILIFGRCFLWIKKNIRLARRFDQSQIPLWQSALLSWTALFLWAATGHGMVTGAIGMTLQFFLLGIFISFDRLMGFSMPVRKSARLYGEKQANPVY